MFIRRKPKADVAVAVQKKDRLFLHVAESGWSGVMVDEAGHVEPIAGGESPDLRELGAKRQESVFRLFAASFPRRRLADIQEIHLLLDDPEVVFVDAKDHQLRAASPSTLIEFGRAQLNAKEVTYGQRGFGFYVRGSGRPAAEEGEFSGGERKQDSVYAFADAGRIRNYLGLLESTALRIVKVVPVGDLMLAQASRQPTSAAALYVAENNSYLALANPAFGIAMVRTIPFGLMTVALKIAEGYDVPPAEALAGLEKRDRLSGIRPGAKEDASASAIPYEDERLLGPMLRQYASAIGATLEFFESQRGAGPVARLEIFGALSRVKGLREFLQQSLGEIASFSDAAPVELFRQAQDSPFINLLQGASGALVTVGKTQYIFSKQGFVSAEELAKETAHILESAVAERRPGSRVAVFKGRQLKPKKKKRGLFDWFANIKAQPQAEPGGTQPEARKDREYFMVFGLVLVGLGYLAWMAYDSADTGFRGRVETLNSRIASNGELRISHIKAAALPAAAARVEADKVLWSEKFLAIGRHLPNEIWLTDVYLADESREVDGKKHMAKKLVIEGGILPSTDGHILRIAALIEKLLADQDYFMSDFKAIAFAGAKTDASDVEEVVRFAIEAQYEEKKRAEAKRTVRKEEQGPIDKSLSSARERSAEMEKSLPGHGGTGAGRTTP